MLTFTFRVDYYPPGPPPAAVMGLAEPIQAQAIGDGKIVELILKYGPKVVAFLVAIGVIKLPPGVTLPFEAEAQPPA